MVDVFYKLSAWMLSHLHEWTKSTKHIFFSILEYFTYVLNLDEYIFF